MVKALVTGASGFTGGYLVKNLLDHNYFVRVLVRPTSNIGSLKAQNVEIVFGDLTSEPEVEEAVKGVDVIFHVAAAYRTAGIPDSAYYDVNVGGTRNILNAAVKFSVQRVVHCSTGGVHGHVEHPPASETAPFRPGDIYQKSKLDGEQLALEYNKTKGLSTTVVRPIGIYGPGDMRMLKMYRMIYAGKFIMFGNGKTLYHLTHVTDIVEGMRLAAETSGAKGQAYLLAGDEYITLNQFALLVAEALNVKPPRHHFPVWPVYFAGFLCEKICVPLRVEPPIFRRRVDIFIKDRAFSNAKAKKELGFAPKVGIREGIQTTAEWYLKMGYLKSKE